MDNLEYMGEKIPFSFQNSPIGLEESGFSPLEFLTSEENKKEYFP